MDADGPEEVMISTFPGIHCGLKSATRKQPTNHQSEAMIIMNKCHRTYNKFIVSTLPQRVPRVPLWHVIFIYPISSTCYHPMRHICPQTTQVKPFYFSVAPSCNSLPI